MSDVKTAEPAAPTRREQALIFFGILIAVMLAMLDNLIVGTAMPRIVGEFGAVEHLSWVVTAYILASTVATPLWGKLGDLYGRKGTLIAAVLIFLAGSATSGAADSMAQLITFRAFQGLGAGGLMVGAMALIGDLLPQQERARYQGMFAAVMALATIGGPLVGGLLTDHLSWRWVFYINLPLGAVALAIIAIRLHLPRKRIEHRIDWLGAALLSVGITALVLITTWGGTEYAWRSPQILGLAAVGVAMLVAFLLVERRASEPIVPLPLFANRNFTVVSSISFLVGFAMFGAVSFLPLYQQTVQRASATNSGLLLLPLMGGAMVMSVVGGRVITKTGRYRAFPIVGTAVMALGMYLLGQLDVDTSRTTSALFMVVLGLGMGCLMQTTMLIAQNSVEMRDMGVATSTVMFFRQIGGSFGVSLFGAVFTRRMTDDLGAMAGKVGTVSSGQFDPAKLDQLAEPARGAVLHAIAYAMQGVFLYALPLAVLGFVVAWFVKHVPLREDGAAWAAKAESTAEAHKSDA